MPPKNKARRERERERERGNKKGTTHGWDYFDAHDLCAFAFGFCIYPSFAACGTFQRGEWTRRKLIIKK